MKDTAEAAIRRETVDLTEDLTVHVMLDKDGLCPSVRSRA